jgi:hypothetical protein
LIVPTAIAVAICIFILLPADIAHNPAMIAFLAAFPSGASVYALIRGKRR